MIYTMGSLFAGIGGFDLGFERASIPCPLCEGWGTYFDKSCPRCGGEGKFGFKTSWQVEIDPYCRKILERHFPHAKRYNDVREVGVHNLDPVDVITGGFPCQDISNAGKRVGIEGERSGLWREYARIIGEIRPKFVVVENVAALLGRGMGRVLGDLAEIRYDAEWEIISAADVIETDHLRERLWIVAHSNSDGYSQRNNDTSNRCKESDGEHSRSSGFGAPASTAIADTASRFIPLEREAGRIRRFGESIPRNGAWKITHQPTLDGTEDGISGRLDRLRALGNAVVPQIPEIIAKRILTEMEREDAA